MDEMSDENNKISSDSVINIAKPGDKNYIGPFSKMDLHFINENKVSWIEYGGISGTHNFEHFIEKRNKLIAKDGITVVQYVEISNTPHPTIKGLYNIEYELHKPLMDRGKPMGGYKVFPKIGNHFLKQYMIVKLLVIHKF